MKLIYRASDINEANIVSGMLRSHGIDAHVGGYYLQGGVGDLAAFDFANVHVPDEDVEQARSLIAQYEAASSDTNDSVTPGDSAKFFISIILFILLFVAVVLFLFGCSGRKAVGDKLESFVTERFSSSTTNRPPRA